jgi:hypothetical protein
MEASNSRRGLGIFKIVQQCQLLNRDANALFGFVANPPER